MPDAICLDERDNLFVGEKYGVPGNRRVDAATGIVTTLVRRPACPGGAKRGCMAPTAACNIGGGRPTWPTRTGSVFWMRLLRTGMHRAATPETGIARPRYLGGTSIHDGEPSHQAFLARPPRAIRRGTGRP